MSNPELALVMAGGFIFVILPGFPFVSMAFLTMLLIYLFPQLAYWLPEVFYDN